MRTTADVIVVGLGAMGSAAAYHLARRGCDIVGFDQFTPPHDRGSSHGQSRIIREAYFEDPSYVPLVQRAYQLWDELSVERDEQLLLQTGGLMIGPADGVLVRGARLSADQHRLPYEQLSADQLNHRFPALSAASDMVGLWEPRAGVLFPEKCISAHLDLANHHGADLHLEEPVRRWRKDGQGVEVETSRGRYRAEQLLITAGSWVSTLVPNSPVPFSVERQCLFWFKPTEPSIFDPAQCAIYVWEYERDRFFYGFPDLGHGVKVAQHHGNIAAHPDTVQRTPTKAEIVGIEELVRRHLPKLALPHIESSVCLYTNTPDQHFYLDHLPEQPHVWIGSPCSGHGFKFSCVIGEIMAQLILDGRSELDISLFRHRPFPSTAPPPHAA